MLNKLKAYSNRLIENPKINNKERIFLINTFREVPKFLAMIFQFMVTIYIFGKIHENIGFYATIVLMLSIILVMFRQLISKF